MEVTDGEADGFLGLETAAWRAHFDLRRRRRVCAREKQAAHVEAALVRRLGRLQQKVPLEDVVGRWVRFEFVVVARLGAQPLRLN